MLRTLISERQINKRIKELAKEIENDFKGEEITFICILKGSIYYFADLTKRIKNEVNIEFMRVSSYGSGTESTGEIQLKLDLNNSIEGKNVIVVEDIIDSGRTLSYLIKYLKIKKPKSLKLCTLLDKPKRRVVKDVKVDYLGFTIPDYFVVGYGLDLDEKYRNIACIKCFVKNKEELKEINEYKKNLS
ncbi:MAG: hypoxanthine phosphoribosyltransferase [Bacilli bacterium]|nr:hypoxanthine phosphoribosyltransferase [Bacilli bacterium]